MMDEGRIAQWTTILKELAGVAGASEFSSLFPSAEVVDASPADLPAGYIRVVGRSGVYEPALTIPGATYTVGDNVILLYVKGAEAIALTQAPGSSGSIASGHVIQDEGVALTQRTKMNFIGAGVTAADNAGTGATDVTIPGGGWKLSNLYVLSSSGDGDFDDVAVALAAMVAGDVLLVDQGNYSCDGLTQPDNTSIIGMSRLHTLFIASAGETLALTVGYDTYLANVGITLSNDDDPSVAVSIPAGAMAYIENCNITADGVGGSVGVSFADGDAYITNCNISGGAYGIEGTSVGDVFLFGGTVVGGCAGTHYHLQDPLISGSFAAGAEFYGTYRDMLTNSIVYGGIDTVYDVDELAGAPAAPGTARWRWYFKSGGMYYEDDLGNEIGPLEAGYPFTVLTVDPTDAAADYSTIGAAVAAAGANTWIQIGPGTYTEDVTAASLNFIAVGNVIIDGDMSISGTCTLIGLQWKDTDDILTTAAGGTYTLVNLRNAVLDGSGTINIYAGHYRNGITYPVTDITLAKDNNIWQTGSGMDDNNYGGSTVISVGAVGGFATRGLVYAPLTSITGTITAAVLRLYNEGSAAGSGDLFVYPIANGNASWPEGTAVGAPQVGSSDWLHHTHNTVNWAGSAGLSTAGTDIAAVVGILTVDGTVAGWDAISLTASTIETMRTGNNNGFLLKFSSEAGNNYCNFTSKEAGANKPILRITYTAGCTAIVAQAGATVNLHNLPTVESISGTGALNGAFSTANGDASARSHAFVVKNTSGGTATAGDVGYISPAGEYKTTTTAYLADAWCVVTSGGANNADIYVTRLGRVTVTLNSNCSAGDYLYTSTTAKQAQPQAYVRPELFAVALTANAGGAGGTCTALLLTNRVISPATSTSFVVGVTSASTSDFVSTIASLPGGAPTTLTYGAVTSGAANTLVPFAGLTIGGYIVLWNTTRGTSALISAVNTGTSTITLTANVPAGWQVGDAITARSQTCTGTLLAGSYYYEHDLSAFPSKPVLAVGVILNTSFLDSGAGGTYSSYHPFEASSSAKTIQFSTQVANVRLQGTPTVQLNQNKFCRAWTASGAGTAQLYATLTGWIIATP